MHRLLPAQTQLLIDLVLNRDAVRIPTEASLHIMALHGPVPRDDVLDRRGEQVAIVGQAGREWRAIVEGVRFLAARELDLRLEGFDGLPAREYGFFFFREVDRHFHGGSFLGLR